MFYRSENGKSEASYTAKNGKFEITVTCDDGWETILDHRTTADTEADAIAYCERIGKPVDHAAEIIAKGFVWNGYCYVGAGR